jgi:hypothetical protein
MYLDECISAVFVNWKANYKSGDRVPKFKTKLRKDMLEYSLHGKVSAILAARLKKKKITWRKYKMGIHGVPGRMSVRRGVPRCAVD